MLRPLPSPTCGSELTDNRCVEPEIEVFMEYHKQGNGSENQKTTQSTNGSKRKKRSIPTIILDSPDVCILEQPPKCNDRIVTCPDCSANINYKVWKSHKCQLKRGTGKLSQDLKSVMLSGQGSDVTVKVKEKEFHLHKVILGARTPLFLSLNNSIKENTMEIVSIDDCDADIFQSLVDYIYTGIVDISLVNVFSLHKVADKYQVDELRKDCLEFVKNTITVDTFCESLLLALAYEEKDLLDETSIFFAKNMKEIIKTAKWEIFLSEHPIRANELLVRSLDHSKS